MASGTFAYVVVTLSLRWGSKMKNIVGALIVAAVIIISVAMWNYFTK
jgi:hypothetical protein